MLNNDLLLSTLSVRLKNPTSNNIIGSGIIYYSVDLKEKVYLFTAAHCLFQTPKTFESPLKTILIDVFNQETKSYITIEETINYNLVSAIEEKDVAVIVLEKSKLESVLYSVEAIKDRHLTTKFVIKGFPLATKGEELDSISPTWKQSMTDSLRFQLNLIEDYTSYFMEGFSGSGVFVHLNNKLYLLGIMTRFRAEEKGRVIYCQYLNEIDALLERNFLSTINYSFISDWGLTSDFFASQVGDAIKGLGPRYNPELNFKLPIFSIFNDLSKDSLFKKKILKIFQKWINEQGGGSSELDKLIHSLIQTIKIQKEEVLQNIQSLNWEVDKPINIDECIQKIDIVDNQISDKINELYDLQYETEKQIPEEKKKLYTYKRSYSTDISYLRRIQSANEEFRDNLSNIKIELANQPYLIIHGEAGCGKSHLLGDIAKNRIENKIPTILILGQLFRSGQSVWQNIINQLGLSCTYQELLISLDSIGRQKGCRVLLMIDALNEGDGKTLWPAELEIFISQVSKYKFIGLVFTLRTTYFDLIPETVKNNDEVTIIKHVGFSGNEYNVLKFFCEHHKLKQPNFPILAPEFANPLFLKLICSGLEAAGEKEFPLGFHGMTSMYNFYIKSITEKLKKRRSEYSLITNLVRQAVEIFALASFQKDYKQMTLDESRQLFEEKFSRYPYLLIDLIEESVFNKTIHKDYETKENIEVLYFAYERFGDYYMAEQLIKPFTNKEEVRQAFQPDDVLGTLITKPYYWHNSGILEALTILVPEKYDLEIFEIYDWVFLQKKKDGYIHEQARDLNYHLIQTLKWRTLQSLNDKRITDWLNSSSFRISFHECLSSFLEMASYKDHPFNSDRLFRILKRYPMPERDGEIQEYFRFYGGRDDEDVAYPLRRLIDWAWEPGISRNIDSETARLVGQTLGWVLSSTYIKLRDETTKAMVNLLEQQPKALSEILKKFSTIDDPYILDRLYAVAYGCSLRIKDIEGLKLLAQYTFNTIFKKGIPPNHILICDYAKSIIELALYKNLNIKGDMQLIKPPYGRKMPILPTVEEIKQFHIEHDHPKFKESGGRTFNQIHHSVMDWDFGRYTIKHALNDFSTTSYTMEEEYKSFLKGLKKIQRDFIKLFRENLKTKHLYNNLDKYDKEKMVKYFKNEKEFDSMVESINRTSTEIQEMTKDLLEQVQYEYFINQIVPFFEAGIRKKDWRRNFFDIEPIKRWIVKRAFELGYDIKLHEDYESHITNWNNYHENKIERIGKKYQWIAFYEILGIMTDNYKIKDPDSSKKEMFYESAIQLSVRNIDPAFTTKNEGKESYWEKEDTDEVESKDWWLDVNYNHWDQPDDRVWANNLIDLPRLTEVLNPIDDVKRKWLYLNCNIKWEKPKPIHENRFDREVKNISYYVESFLVQKKDKIPILDKLIKSPDIYRQFPEFERESELFNRENYWVIDLLNRKKKNDWKLVGGTKIKVVNTISDAVSEMSEDKSGAHYMYKMPSRFVFDSLELMYDSPDGNFINSDGILTVQSVHPTGTLIDQDILLSFLENNNLEIIWVIRGEKLSWNQSRDYSFIGDTLSVCSIDEGKLVSKTVLINND